MAGGSTKRGTMSGIFLGILSQSLSSYHWVGFTDHPGGLNPSLQVHTELYDGDGLAVASTWLFYGLNQIFSQSVPH